MRKKTIAAMLIIAGMTLVSCKKEKTTDPEPEPTPTTPVTPSNPAFEGFKIVDNMNQTVISDSAYAYSNTNNDRFYINSFKNDYRNVSLVFKPKMVSVQTYPLDSLDLELSSIMYGAYGFDIKSGSVSISSISSTKISGTFVFDVQVKVGSSTRTKITGTFNNVKVKS